MHRNHLGALVKIVEVQILIEDVWVWSEILRFLFLFFFKLVGDADTAAHLCTTL